MLMRKKRGDEGEKVIGNLEDSTAEKIPQVHKKTRTKVRLILIGCDVPSKETLAVDGSYSAASDRERITRRKLACLPTPTTIDIIHQPP